MPNPPFKKYKRQSKNPEEPGVLSFLKDIKGEDDLVNSLFTIVNLMGEYKLEKSDGYQLANMMSTMYKVCSLKRKTELEDRIIQFDKALEYVRKKNIEVEKALALSQNGCCPKCNQTKTIDTVVTVENINS